MTRFAVRRLGRTELRATEIGLGCASMGRPERSDDDAVRAIRVAIDYGVNYLDTSAGYGESERRVGLALEGGWRDKVYLQTKTGTHPDRRGDYTAAGTRWSVENSLRQLRTDYLDAVLIHDPADVGVPLSPGFALDELLKMKDEGLIRFVGIGCRDHGFHRRAIETGHMDIVLTFLDYTLLNQSVMTTTLPLARQHDVGVQLASVLGCWSGALAGTEPVDNPAAHVMWTWCQQRGVSLRHLALRFALAAPIEGIVIVGPGTPSHVEDVCREALTSIPAEIWQDFKAEFGVGV